MGHKTQAAPMVARYRGRCATTGHAIYPGDTIRVLGFRRVELITAAGRPLSDVIRTSGGVFYRNRGGRCEDAPCCGCCTI